MYTVTVPLTYKHVVCRLATSSSTHHEYILHELNSPLGLLILNKTTMLRPYGTYMHHKVE